MAENPVIRKFGEASGAGRPAPSADELNALYAQPAYAGPRGSSRYMTLDDVVQRTGAMLGVLLLAGGASWALTPHGVPAGLLIVSLMGALGVGLYISFTMKANAALCLLYSALEGTLLGAISRA